MRKGTFIAVFGALLAFGCGASATDNPIGENPGPGADGGDNPGDGGPFDAGNCGEQEEEIELINLGDPPDMLIVLDRSGSMITPPGFPPLGTSKWSIMEGAINDLLDARENNLRFGLSVFPTDSACGVSPGAAVDIGLGNASAIESWLDGSGPDGNTPAHQALEEALDIYSAIPVNPEGRFVLFATDGAPNCNPTVDDDGSAETVAAVTALNNAGIETFVLGFGAPFGLPTGVLNDAAQAGGRARASSPFYYEAENAQDLTDAFNEIIGGVITPSCSYRLAEAPLDPDLVTVKVNGVAVPRTPSKTEGWEYHPDAMTITFFGDVCTEIESGSVGSVQFIFGCPGPIAQ